MTAITTAHVKKAGAGLRTDVDHLKGAIKADLGRITRKNQDTYTGWTRHPIVKYVVTQFAAFKMFFGTLCELESFVEATLSLISVYIAYRFDSKVNVSWVLVSVAIVFPIVYSIGNAFKRREDGLKSLASLKAQILALTAAFFQWNWHLGKGRNTLPEEFNEQAEASLLTLIELFKQYCKTPQTGQTIHMYTSAGRAYMNSVAENRLLIVHTIEECYIEITENVEKLKDCGLAPPEAGRAHGSIHLIMRDFGELQNLKEYRTPAATRAFTRVYMLMMPIVYAPYFAMLQPHVGLPFCMVLSVLTSHAIVALHAVQLHLEDPFEEGAHDSIRISQLFDELSSAIKRHRANCTD